jgi:putative redox protein
MAYSDAFTFAGGSGASLAARLERPAGPLRAVALFAHCFTCGKASLAATRIARALAEHGIATLRFDFTGLGDSEGEFANSDFAANVADIVAAADHLRATIGAPSLLVGHSLGGAAVIAAASAIADVKAVATIGAPFDVAHVLHQFSDGLADVERAGEAEVAIGGRRFRVRRDFIETARAQDQRARLRALKRALLVLHAPTDQTVGIDNAGEIFAAALHPKSFVALDGADHLLTRAEDAAFAARMIAAWAERYLDRAAATDAVEPGRIVVESLPGKFTQLVRAGRHRFVADEPATVGGDDRGPGPYDLLLAALGACTSMTLRLYAERKGIALGPVRVDLKHSRDYVRDCADCDGKRIETIDRAIAIEGSFDDATRARLMEIADKCPVHRTLSEGVRVSTRAV